MAVGTVSWFDPQRGTGVILLDDGTEIPVQRSHIDGGGSQSLREHDRVGFDLREEAGGLRPSGVYLL
jgi:cold shock CspA family protein